MPIVSNAQKISSEPNQYNSNEQFKVYTERHWEQIPYLKDLSEEVRFNMRVVAKVLPFRVNQYVLDELIDWSAAPDDPIFRLVFPQPEMLTENNFARMADLLKNGADKASIQTLVDEIRQTLNPHPAGQQQLNVPRLGDDYLEGMQHKYRDTVLFFPSQGQTCHSYCTFCFRWAQFVGDKDLRFAARETAALHQYLQQHKEVSDLLVTGGDPMVMKTRRFQDIVEPLIEDKFDHVQTLRIGSKSLSFWPQRFVTDADADDLLRTFEQLVNAGKHVAFMAHFNHWRELESDIVKEAIRRIRDTGVIIRSQAPLLANINDDAETWSTLWRNQVKQGIIPYYMFVERDTGARHYFEVPLAKAWKIYRAAMQSVSGLGRTARGPCMSAGPGKIEIQGVTDINGEKVFVLRFVQGRNPDWVQKPFFAKYDENVTWFDQLKPAFGEKEFFFEKEYQSMHRKALISSANV